VQAACYRYIAGTHKLAYTDHCAAVLLHTVDTTGFQVANLWLILIGGSLFNQLSAMIEDVNSIVPLIGAAVSSLQHLQILSTHTRITHDQ
jgi:hypothetical protein